MADKLSIIITPIISTAMITKEVQKFENMVSKKPIKIPVAPIDKKVKDSIKDTKGSIAELFSAIGKVAIWTVATSAIFGTIRALKGLIKEFVNLEDQLVAIERVTAGLSMDKIFNESLDAAIELGVGLKDVLAITEELGRTYADLDEVQLRAAASNAVLLASVTDMTSETAVSGLIAITQAYNIAIEDSISVVDALNVVNNNYAIGAADLSRSLERSASAAAEVGVGFANLIGYTTAIKTSTRESGSVIGNSLKTIVIRLQSNAEAIREVEEAGVAVYGEDGQLRRAEDIISDIAGKWDTLSKNQKVNIGVAVAGQRQYTRFAALMQNFDIATESAAEAVSNQGNALEENEKRLKTVSAQMAILGSKTLNLAQSFGETLKPVLVALIATAHGVIEVMTWLIDTFGKGGVWVISFTVAIWGLFKGLAALSGGIYKTTTALSALGTTAATVAPFLLIGAAIALLISQVIKYNKLEKEKIAIQNKSIEAIRNESVAIDDLTNKYRKLKDTSDLTTEQETELLNVQSELATLIPSLTTIEDAYGNTILVSVKLLEKELELLNQINTKRAISELSALTKAIDEATNSVNVITHASLDYELIETEQIDSLEEIGQMLEDGVLTTEQAALAYKGFANILAQNTKLLNSYADSLVAVEFGTLDIGKANNDAIDTFKRFAEEEEVVAANLVGARTALNGLVKDIVSGTNTTDAMTKAFRELGFSYEDYMNTIEQTDELDPFTSSELNDFKIFNNVMQDLFGVTEDNIKAVGKALDIIKLYGNATELSTTQQNEYNMALGFLSDMFPQLEGNIIDNMDVVKAFADTWTLAAANQDAYVESVSAGIIPVTEATAEAIGTSIEALEAQAAVIEANIAVTKSNMSLLGGATSAIQAAESQIAYSLKLLDDVKDRIDGLKDISGDIKVMDIEGLKTSSEIIQGIIDMQDEASDNFIDNLETEKDAFSDLIDHQLSELDRLEASMRFEDTISELADERLSLESQIARLQGDNSIEGISKRKDLEEELAKLKEDLDDEFQDREFELRKQNLESIQSLIENEYDLKIEKEKELNEIIKERIEAQSKALKDDVTALQILQEILLSGEGLGISTFLESLKDTGFFDFSGIDPTLDDPVETRTGGTKPTILVETVVINGGATEADGKAFGVGLTDFAIANGIDISVNK